MFGKDGAFTHCESCGKKFRKKTIWHMYCNDKCKMNGFYLRKADEIKKENESKISKNRD